MMARTHIAALATTAIVSTLVASPALAQAQVNFNLPAQELAKSLQDVARATSTNVVFDPAQIAGKQAQALSGQFTVEGAIARLIAGQSLTTKSTGSGTWVVSAVGNGSAALTGAASSAQAAPSSLGDDEAGNPAVNNVIVVTGTNIRGQAPVGSSLITITQKDITRSGYSSTSDLIRSVPQNYNGGQSEGNIGNSFNQNAFFNGFRASSPNLRGLGNDATLTLIDGRRATAGGALGTVADLSMIPLTAVDHIDILTDGASAIYGSDAIAGVINVVLRDRFEGGELSARFGTVTDGHHNEIRLSGSQGLGWSTGSLFGSFELYRRSRLAANDRRRFSEDLTPFGGPDLRSLFSNPGNLIGPDSIFGLPPQQDGTALAPADLLTTPNLTDRKSGTDILPEQRRWSGFFALRQELGSDARLTAQAFYGERHFDQRVPNADGILSVPSSNPFYINPFSNNGEDVTVFYSFEDDLGQERNRGHLSGGFVNAAVDWDFSESFALSLAGTFSRDEGRVDLLNIPNFFNLADALADPNRETSLNPFGAGSNTNPETLDAIRGYQQTFTKNRYASGSARLNGRLFELPGGYVRFALGADYRHENVALRDISFIQTPSPFESTEGGKRSITSFYGEIVAPLVRNGHSTGVRELLLSAAVRTENYSDFGRTTNPKIGLIWSPLAGLKFHSSFGRSFRAPTFQDLSSPEVYFQFSYPDPQSPSGAVDAVVLQGVSPDLGPEKAKTWSVGFDAHPTALPQLRLGATLFNIRYRNRIADPIVFFATALSDPALGVLVTRDPSDASVEQITSSPFFFGTPPPPGSIGAIVDLRKRNLSTSAERGIDFNLGWSSKLAGGGLDANLEATYLLRYEQAVTAQSSEQKVLGYINGPVKFRARGSVSWNRGPLDVAAFMNFVGAYRNNAVAPTEPVHSWLTFDANVAYDFPRIGAALSLNVRNLFDRPPPYVLNILPGSSTAIGFDPQQADAIGRFVTLQITKRW